MAVGSDLPKVPSSRRSEPKVHSITLGLYENVSSFCGHLLAF